MTGGVAGGVAGACEVGVAGLTGLCRFRSKGNSLILWDGGCSCARIHVPSKWYVYGDALKIRLIIRCAPTQLYVSGAISKVDGMAARSAHAGNPSSSRGYQRAVMTRPRIVATLLKLPA